MKIKVKIVCEAVYSIDPDLYDAKNEEDVFALERTFINDNPLNLIEMLDAMGKSIFTTHAEVVK